MSAPGVWRAPAQPAGARERLLREIVARVPIERIAEIHLFPPMRQGGVEMGVAVIAAEPEPIAGEAVLDVGTAGDEAPDAPPELAAVSPAVDESAIDGAGDPATTARAVGERADAPVDAAESAPAAAAACDPTDGAAGPPPESNGGADDADARDPNVATGTDRSPEPAATRYTVLTARYRLTLKGPDRGRWEADVTVEADAPLLTVDAVVRGVQRRAGDGVAPERLDAAAIAAALAPPGFPTPKPGPAPA